jgi:transcriptional regulator NrdR family protein
MIVIKRDNTEETFDRSKLVRVAAAAGLSDDEAVKVALKVEQQIESQDQEKIPSSLISELMSTELNSVSQYAANLYKWYEKTKYKNSK